MMELSFLSTSFSFFVMTMEHLIAPTEQDVHLAKVAQRLLVEYLDQSHAQTLRVGDEKTGTQAIEVPASALRVFAELLGHMAQGKTITLLPVDSELTTQEAADMLHVSRPFLVKLLEEKRLPYRKVGTRRRLQLQDVLAYKRQIDEARLHTLEELAAEAQKLDMGY
jgi:excisionase family DNA binding protein